MTCIRYLDARERSLAATRAGPAGSSVLARLASLLAIGSLAGVHGSGFEVSKVFKIS